MDRHNAPSITGFRVIRILEKAVSEEKIRQLSRSIMDVLWFSLWNKAE